MLTMSASILLLSSLGVLLAAKIVLGLLLAVGPLFIALALFDSTRGLFEGWLRASVAFGFAPLATTLLLSVALTMLEPSLLQIEDLRKHGVFMLGPVYSVTTLVLVFAGVSFGAIIAGGMIAAGFRLPARQVAAPSGSAPVLIHETSQATPARSRASQVAAAASAMDRRDTALLASTTTHSSLIDRRTSVTRATGQTPSPFQAEPRLGQTTRRTARPRTPRPTARSA